MASFQFRADRGPARESSLFRWADSVSKICRYRPNRPWRETERPDRAISRMAAMRFTSPELDPSFSMDLKIRDGGIILV